MEIEVRLMHIQPCRKIQIGLLKVRLAVEVSAYCSYYFLCLSFQFSMYFVISEMRVIWVIPCIFNSNIDQKRFCVCKSSRNLSACFGWILCISKYNFFEKAHFETLSNAWFNFFGFKKLFSPFESWNKRALIVIDWVVLGLENYMHSPQKKFIS